MTKGFGKGFAVPCNKKKHLLFLVGDGVSPEVLRKDPLLAKQYGKLSVQDFVWVKINGLEEFC
ncbi:hypothetical protein C7B79_14225, partial [Chroococcidiopsis cubana CCALA 043]